jgi:hypothetical protein
VDLFVFVVSLLVLVYVSCGMMFAIRDKDKTAIFAHVLLMLSAFAQLLWLWMLRIWPWGIRGAYEDRFFYSASSAVIFAALSFLITFRMEGIRKLVHLIVCVFTGTLSLLCALYSSRPS